MKFNGNLKLAIQKNGRLTEKSINLLRACGLDIENYSERLVVSARNYKLDVLFVRDDDIPEYVQDGVADIGFIGENVLFEKKKNAFVEKKLGFGKCRLLIGIPEDKELASVKELNNKKIATSYPNILGEFLETNSVQAQIIQISGSVEIAPSLGMADYICDIVSTGNTLKLNKLKKSFSVFESEAVMIRTENLEVEKKPLLEELMGRIDSVMNARKSNYLMMNVPNAAVERISEIIPGVGSPTILPLADKNMHAVHAVIPEETFWQIKTDLVAAGASGILLLPINNMIL